jgi:hypothetical protein
VFYRNAALDEADGAMSHARMAQGAVHRAASQASTAAVANPELADRYQAIAEQFWVMVDVIRDAERSLGELHAQVRSQQV